MSGTGDAKLDAMMAGLTEHFDALWLPGKTVEGTPAWFGYHDGNLFEVTAEGDGLLSIEGTDGTSEIVDAVEWVKEHADA